MIRKYIKFILPVVVFFWFNIIFVFARTDDMGWLLADCKLSMVDDIDTYITSRFEYDTIFPKDAIKRAFVNLRSHCCTRYQLKDSAKYSGFCKENMLVDFYPQSEYLFDHLVDVMFRRLDVEDLYQDVEPDPVALEWKEYTTEIAEDAWGNHAWAMRKKYDEYWESNYTPIQYREDVDEYCKDKNSAQFSLIERTLDLYSSSNLINLHDRYSSVCALSMCMYRAIWQTNGVSFLLEKPFGVCESIASQRIQEEQLYAKSLVMQESTKSLWDAMHSYLYNYFGKRRLVNLQETIMRLVDLFSTIWKMAPEWTKESN